MHIKADKDSPNPRIYQVKQYGDLGLKVPTSTLNGWGHAVASRLEPVYEALRDDIRNSDYLQIDEVPLRIADSPGKSRKGYAWQFLDNRPQSHGLYFLYMNGSRAGAVPRAELRDFRGTIQTDGYGIYDYFELLDNVALLGAWLMYAVNSPTPRHHIPNWPRGR